MAMTRLPDPTPRMTLPRALLSEALRLARSPLAAVHLVCGLAAGLACGEYFSVTRWDPALGADAYAQFLGALMPLMSAIVCGLRRGRGARCPGRLANLTAVPSRGRAVAAKLLAPACSARARWPWRRRIRGRARRRRRRVGPLACGRLGGHRAGQPAPLRAGARRGPAPRPQRRYRRRRGGDAPRVLLSGRTCARPHDRRAHRCPGDTPELGAARLARAPGVARGRGLHRRRTRGGPSPHDCARWPRAHPGQPPPSFSPGSAASRTGGQMRRKPLAAVLALLSAALVLGGNALLDAGWGSAPRSIADRVLPNPEIAMWAPAPRLRAGLWTAERGASTMPTGVSGGRTWRGYWQWM